MKRAGVGLPIVLLITLVISVMAYGAAHAVRDTRERWMAEASERDLIALMAAADQYRTLYNTLPRRLADLNKVGYHESGGMVVCTFRYNQGAAPGTEYLDVVIRHRAAQTGAWTEYPSGQRTIRIVRVPECRSARRGNPS